MRRGGVLAVALGFLAGACAGSSPGRPAPRGSPPKTVTIAAAAPVGLTVAAGRVWTADAGGADVTGRAGPTAAPLRVHVGATPLRTAYDGSFLWVTVFGAGQVVAVNPATGRVVRRVRVPGQPEGIVAAFGAVWVVRQGVRLLTRISADGEVGPSYRLGQEPRLVTASNRALFASNFLDGTVTRVDPRSGATRTSGFLCAGAQGLALTATTLWVTCTPAGVVVAVDARTLAVKGRVAVHEEPDAVRVVGTTVYVVTTDGPTLVTLDSDPQHPVVVQRTVLGTAPPLNDQANVDAVMFRGAWWVSSPAGNRVLVYSP